MSSFGSIQAKRSSRWGNGHSRRRLFFEPLEARRVLAANIAFDVGGGNAGALDTSFGANGTSIANVAGIDNVWDTAIQPDGKIVVVGSTGSPAAFAIARFHPDGALDSGFSGDGIVTLPFSGGFAEARAVSVSSGRIFVAGYATRAIGNFDIVLVRLNPDGMPDDTFGEQIPGDPDGLRTGLKVHEFGGSERATGMALHAGKIILAGDSIVSGESDFAVARFNETNGDVDTTFGAGGLVRIDSGDAIDTGEAVGVQSIGSEDFIIVAGTQGNLGRGVVMRIGPNDQLDRTFAEEGFAFVDSPVWDALEDVQSVVVQPDQAIVVVGSVITEEGTDVLMTRLTPGGITDTSFSHDGFVIVNIPGGEGVFTNDVGFDVALQNDGKILVVGETDAFGEHFLLIRFDTAGDLDTGFNETGVVATDLAPGAEDSARAVAIQDDGKIVVAGISNVLDADFALARFLSEGGGAPPAAVVGVEGDLIPVTITGTFSGLEHGQSIVIDWGDGTLTPPDAITNGAFSLTSHLFADNSTSIRAVIVDAQAAEVVYDFYPGVVDVENVEPLVAPLNGPNSGVRGQEYSFVGAFTDAGILDTHEVAWDFGNGWQIDFHSSTDPGALSPVYAYPTTGTYTVTLSVLDDDGGVTSISTVVSVVVAELQTDPSDGSKLALAVGGTTGSDNIDIRPSGGNVEVFIGEISQGVFAPTGGVIVYGGVGNDDLQVAGSISRTAWLYGGDGDDRVKGGGGNDVLLGGEGADLLVGGQGRDLLIGGLGADRIVGNADDDVLISGTTDHDGDPTALAHILAEWTSTRGYFHRVVNLYGGYGCDGDNGTYYLNHDTVHDDNAADVLTGSQGQDLFFGNFSLDDDATVKDKITDLHASEFAIDIDFIESE